MSRSPDFVLEYGLGLPPPVTALIGICVGTAFGYLLGKLCLRVKGPYLSLLSIGFAIIILMIINNEEWLTRGPLGFAAPPFFGGYQNNMIYAYFSVALAIFTIFINYKIAISELGLCLRAVGDDEILASSLGIDIVNVKVKIFVISSFFASLAGIIWAHYRYVCLDLGKLETMFLVIAMVVFGGIGTLIGPIIGAIIIYPLSEYLRISYGIYHMLILSGIILIIYRILPNGIIGLIRKLIPLRL
jgi:branched-chain amino acid transport system permease protein